MPNMQKKVSNNRWADVNLLCLSELMPSSPFWHMTGQEVSVISNHVLGASGCRHVEDAVLPDVALRRFPAHLQGAGGGISDLEVLHSSQSLCEHNMMVKFQTSFLECQMSKKSNICWVSYTSLAKLPATVMLVFDTLKLREFDALTGLSILRCSFSLRVGVNGNQRHFVLSIWTQLSQDRVGRNPRHLSLWREN